MVFGEFRSGWIGLALVSFCLVGFALIGVGFGFGRIAFWLVLFGFGCLVLFFCLAGVRPLGLVCSFEMF